MEEKKIEQYEQNTVLAVKGLIRINVYHLKSCPTQIEI